MRIELLNPALLRRALAIYLSHAWPGRAGRKGPEVPEDRSGDELLDLFTDETKKEAGRASRRFILRLGNRRYPHMKLVFEEYLVPEEFVFSVDTHDELELKPDYPDYEAWQELKERNREIKGRIEESWRSAGIPTYASLRDIVRGAERRPAREVPHAKILVADDQREIADAVASILIEEGYDVLLAHDGEEAAATALRERPDLILMDYQMPRLDGVQAAQRIRRSLPKRECRILLATAALMDLSAVEEADGFLMKPYSREILISFIQALLRQR